MLPSFLVVLIKRTVLLIAALLGGSPALAQYARGDEIPIRPDRASVSDIHKTMSLEEYLAQEAYQKAQSSPAPLPQSQPPLTVEKLSPPPPAPRGKTRTVIIEQAIYRCEKGSGFVFVDKDNKNKFSKCILMHAEKTAEIPLDLEPPPPAKPDNACPGTIYYRGNTYAFNDNEPCPIPEAILLQLLPVATRPF